MGCWLRKIAILVSLFILWSAMVCAAQPITIGMSSALSGRYAPMGDMYAKGLHLWEEEINKKGGIRGRSVKLVVHDDRSSPQEAAKIYRQMITKEGVDLVLGPYSSGISAAIAPIVEQYHYPTLLPLAAADYIWANSPKYVFGMHTSARRWARAILAYLALHEIKRIGLLASDSLFALGVPKAADKWARRLSLDIVLRERLDPDRLDEQVQRARDLDVQALLVWCYLDGAVMVRKALDRVDWYPQVYFSHIGPALEKYHEILGPLADLTVGTSVWEPGRAELYPGGREFVERFEAKYGTKPSYHAAMGFAAGEVLARALLQAGDIDREVVRNKLANLDMITIVGRYGVDSQGMQVRHSPLVIQWQDGKKKVLWPRPLGNAHLQFRSEERP